MLRKLAILFPALPLCAALLGLQVSHRIGVIAYIGVTILTPLLARSTRVAAMLDRYARVSVAVAVFCWVVVISRIGYFWGLCAS